MNPGTIGSGEVLLALLVIAIPLIALGSLVWKQATAQSSLKSAIEGAAEKAASSSDGVKRIEANVAAMREELHRDYVRQDALRETESRIGRRIDGVDTSVGKRLDGVESAVRDTASTIIAALTGVEPPPPRRRRPAP